MILKAIAGVLSLLLFAGPAAAQGALGQIVGRNTIDASRISGFSDPCAQAAQAIVVAYQTYGTTPGGANVDITGIPSMAGCNSSIWAPYNGATPTIPPGTFFPLTLIIGSQTLPAITQVNVANIAPNMATPYAVTISATNQTGSGVSRISQLPFASPTIVAGAVYASGSGSGTACTFGNPCLLPQAVTNARAGGAARTIYLRAGVHSFAASAGSCGGVTNNGLVLNPGGTGSGDDGDFFTYYPPDGPNTAVVDGTTNAMGTFICSGGALTTVNGIQVRNFNHSAYYMARPYIIMNGIIHDITGASAINVVGNNSMANSMMLNNFVYNVDQAAIDQIPNNQASSFNNLLISGNFTYNVNRNCNDCGVLYTQDTTTSQTPVGNIANLSTGIRILNNYVRDNGAGGGGRCVYLDDGASNTLVANNICTGTAPNGAYCWQLHGGNNNIYVNNMCDLGTTTNVGTMFFQQTTSAQSAMTVATGGGGGTGTTSITFTGTVPANANGWYVVENQANCRTKLAQNTKITAGQGTATVTISPASIGTIANADAITVTPFAASGNFFQNNVVIGNTTGSDGGIGTSGCTPNNINLASNNYFQYSSGSLVTTGNTIVNAETNITFMDPKFVGQGFAPYGGPNNDIALQPVHFMALPQVWGPPNFVVPALGHPPTSNLLGLGVVGQNTFAVLGNTCTPFHQGVMYYNTDGAATPVYNATATGAGTAVVPVFCNGTNWVNH